MYTSRELKNFLEEISEDAKYVKFDFASPEKFNIEIRCKVEKDKSSEYYNKHVTHWIRTFSKFTATTWIVKSCFPRIQRSVFRKTFACHLSANNKIKTSEKTRNRECKAIIDFKIKFVNKNTMKNDPWLRQDLNLCIRIIFQHTHKVGARESFRLLKSTPDTDRVFYAYFDGGHTATTAKAYHELLLINKHGDRSVNLSNLSINPSPRHVFYLRRKWQSKGGASKRFEDIMAVKKEHVTNAGGILYYDDPQMIVMISPAMRRVIGQFIFDDVIIHTTGLDTIVTTFLYVPSKTGVLCFACILHDKELTEKKYKQAFSGIKLLLESMSNKSFEPNKIMVNHYNNQRNVLATIFPNSRVTIWPWTIRCDAWRRIWENTNKPNSAKLHNLMVNITSVLHANSLEMANEYYEYLYTNECVTANEALQEYLAGIWQQKDHWIDENKNDLIEFSVRVNEELVIQRCKSFNVYAMIDIIMNIMDSHSRQILHAYVKGGDHIIYTYIKLLNVSNNLYSTKILRQTENEYVIDRFWDKTSEKATFRTDTWCCDCKIGRRGQFCEHLCVITNSDEVDLKIAALTEDDKRMFIELAGGDAENIKNLPNQEDTEVKEEEDDTYKIDNIDNKSETSTKSICDDDYYYLEIKKENLDNTDPLEDTALYEEAETEDAAPEPVAGCSTWSDSDFKMIYENSLKSLNNQFRRLNKFFKENPNVSNKETMVRLARELQKIRPVEKVNLNNMSIELNSRARKRKSNDDDSDD